MSAAEDRDVFCGVGPDVGEPRSRDIFLVKVVQASIEDPFVDRSNKLELYELRLKFLFSFFGIGRERCWKMTDFDSCARNALKVHRKDPATFPRIVTYLLTPNLISTHAGKRILGSRHELAASAIGGV